MPEHPKIRNFTVHHQSVLLSCMVLFCLTALAGCGPMRLNSHWLDRPLNIDGFADDWEGLLTPVGKGVAYVGVMNDSNYVYLCVMSAKAQLQRRLARQGLLVWFQPQDQDKAPLGIRYPVSVLAAGKAPRSGGPDPASSDGRQPDDRVFTQELSVVEIVGPSNQDRRRVSIDSIPGVDVKVSGQKEWFVYELRIPLARPDHYPLAIDAKAGQYVIVRLESEKPDMSMMPGRGRDQGEGGRGDWGRGGFAGGGMGRRGQGEHGGAGQAPEQFDVSAKVQLAPAPPV